MYKNRYFGINFLMHKTPSLNSDEGFFASALLTVSADGRKQKQPSAGYTEFSMTE